MDCPAADGRVQICGAADQIVINAPPSASGNQGTYASNNSNIQDGRWFWDGTTNTMTLESGSDELGFTFKVTIDSVGATLFLDGSGHVNNNFAGTYFCRRFR